MRILVTGASGQLGSYLLDELIARGGDDLIGWCRTSPGAVRSRTAWRAVDLTDDLAIDSALTEADPDVVIHLAAMSTADSVRRDPALARRVNVQATQRLAHWCKAQHRRLIFTSTDMVFDGERGGYREDEPLRPILEYGRTKAEAEPAVLAIPRGVVARVSLLFGASRAGRESFFDRAVGALRRGEPQTFFEDEFRTPLHYAIAAHLIADLVRVDYRGVLNVGGTERVSRYELMTRAARALGLDATLVRGNRRGDVLMAEPRPRDLSLDPSRLTSVLPSSARPTIEESIAASGG